MALYPKIGTWAVKKLNISVGIVWIVIICVIAMMIYFNIEKDLECMRVAQNRRKVAF